MLATDEPPLAVARIAGETAPLLFTALSNQFWSTDLSAPMANVPMVIFQFAMSPYESWNSIAWAGAFVAARQSFLQWYPPQEASCGRDFYGMIETFPLQRVVPMIFKGSALQAHGRKATFKAGRLAKFATPPLPAIS